MEVGYRTAVAARWSDMDSFRHINNAAVVTLLEEARIPWLFAPERPTAALADGVFLADLRVRYRGQLVLEDSPVEVVMWISRIRAADFTIVAELRPRGTDEAEPASVVSHAQLAAVDLENQRIRRLSPAERAYLEEFRRD
ncbi:acyl-CoA thioesterase [Tomitella cavernea]|uniref:acyl-CoA thioesterase n=1 Tax=Tomitella cavernea TaxID=1387982 RepID=UPI0019044CCD|nr:thioesterase family protein [Tomitella cavernea]